MSLKEEILVKMALLGIQPKRSLGQNFLIGEHIVGKIFEHLEKRAPSFIVEVGPGLGTLTERLIERRWSRKLIELDSHFARYWVSRGEDVYEGDALRVPWGEWRLPQGTLLLGNLPYQIGARLIVSLCLGPQEISHLLIMLQKEVAERLTAPPRTKEYGALSVLARTFWEVSAVVDASGEDFFPKPNVNSRVVSLRRKNVEANLGEGYMNFVKQAFQQRRKFMIKSFKSQADALRGALTELGYKDSVRAEEVSPQDFERLYTLTH